MREIPPIDVKFSWDGSLEYISLSKKMLVEKFGYTEEEADKFLEELWEIVQEDLEWEKNIKN
jgi:hypothetical protein